MGASLDGHSNLRAPQASAPSYENLRAILIDDDLPCLEEQVDTLSSLNLQCAGVQTAEEALEQIEQNKDINLVITDLRMPNHDGLWLLREIQSRFGSSRRFAAIILTGHITTDAAIAAMRLDAVDFLTKPISRQDYADALSRAAIRLAEPQASKAGMADLPKQLEDIRQAMDKIATSLDTAGGAPTATDAGRGEITAQELRTIIKARRARSEYFDADMFADPAWDILLDLMLARIEGSTESISSLCIAAAVPMTTAMRWIRELIARGVLIRWPDPDDGRRNFVALSEQAAKQMTAYLQNLPAVRTL